MRDFKYRAWHAQQSRMFAHKEITVLAKNIRNDSVWTYMQYIGLCDKNGVEIYEGDIVRLINRPDEPKESDHMQGVGMVSFDGKEQAFRWGGFKIFHWENTDSIEVIGNYFENPELRDECVNLEVFNPYAC